MQLSDYDSSWAEQAEHEGRRVLAALGGQFTEGGVVETIEPVGATSVPGLPARPCIDLALAVWPFPLPPQRQAALEALGYTLVAGFTGPPEQRLRRSDGAFQLLLVDSGSERWADYLIVRDYLRENQAARQELAERKRAWAAGATPESYQAAKDQWFPHLIEAAQQWWIAARGFAPVQAAVAELAGFPEPWYVAGGWALDLFLGRVARVHHDVDIAIPFSAQLQLQAHLAARGWGFVTPYEKRLEPWPPHMRLELPRHQVHAHRQGAFIDFVLTDMDDRIWRYRRNPAAIRAIDRAGLRTEAGVAYLAPELVLLFKSKTTSGQERAKDQADFEKIFPHLEPERRAWLRWALVAIDPEHPWIERLGPG